MGILINLDFAATTDPLDGILISIARRIQVPKTKHKKPPTISLAFAPTWTARAAPWRVRFASATRPDRSRARPSFIPT